MAKSPHAEPTVEQDELSGRPTRSSVFNPFRVLRYSDYKFVWSAEALSLWAIEMEIIVLAMFVLSDTGSPLLVGLIGALKFAGTLLGPVYGLMVDRFDPKRWSDFCRNGCWVVASSTSRNPRARDGYPVARHLRFAIRASSWRVNIGRYWLSNDDWDTGCDRINRYRIRCPQMAHLNP